jgi:hypothetical protein
MPGQWPGFFCRSMRFRAECFSGSGMRPWRRREGWLAGVRAFPPPTTPATKTCRRGPRRAWMGRPLSRGLMLSFWLGGVVTFPCLKSETWGTQGCADCGFLGIGGGEFRDGTGFPRIQATRR